ncbi:S1C family serine protease [Clostridium tyrobutyricum]|uniref:S1C family serine protease n=1 Tax=Clostridium tyrobutyricum TaxID=1519 RepID=UPI001C382A4D|nr:trypsin-like peptidase domain-containing protein [Clostridium tyrobutyricum]MBV4428773.1 trypsin-like peptidase domain-containing protein [Clostridium tyrobutyricum]MBV4443914.1 trypsin-like peptidase domain-containing protein [Clostridium tyrobutyricum]
MESKNNILDGKFKGKKFLSYIAVAIIASLIGGSICASAFLYIVPNTNFFKNTPLYESIRANTISNQATTKSSQQASPISTSNGTGLTTAEIAKKVSPAVVGVSVKSIVQNNSFSNSFGYSDDNDSGTSEQDGMGSGIIINSDGYILTNYHVVQNAQSINVILTNKKQVSAKLVNYDSNQDLAVIKVTSKTTMPAIAELGDSSKVEVGDPVVAIGNPLGTELLGSVTSGIISATNRAISVGNTKQSFLQTDAAINPGNSGGALVNSMGQVIGINSAKIGGSGVEGIGFAIPINTVKSKLSGLLKPFLKLGIAGREIDSTLSQQYGIPKGVYVVEVEEFSSAEKAGIKVGDIIQKFDGKSISSVNDINTLKSKHKSGDIISIVVSRNNSTKTLSLTLTE